MPPKELKPRTPTKGKARASGGITKGTPSKKDPKAAVSAAERENKYLWSVFTACGLKSDSEVVAAAQGTTPGAANKKWYRWKKAADAKYNEEEEDASKDEGDSDAKGEESEVEDEMGA